MGARRSPPAWATVWNTSSKVGGPGTGSPLQKNAGRPSRCMPPPRPDRPPWVSPPAAARGSLGPLASAVSRTGIVPCHPAPQVPAARASTVSNRWASSSFRPHPTSPAAALGHLSSPGSIKGSPSLLPYRPRSGRSPPCASKQLPRSDRPGGPPLAAGRPNSLPFPLLLTQTRPGPGPYTGSSLPKMESRSFPFHRWRRTTAPQERRAGTHPAGVAKLTPFRQ